MTSGLQSVIIPHIDRWLFFDTLYRKAPDERGSRESPVSSNAEKFSVIELRAYYIAAYAQVKFDRVDAHVCLCSDVKLVTNRMSTKRAVFVMVPTIHITNHDRILVREERKWGQRLQQARKINANSDITGACARVYKMRPPSYQPSQSPAPLSFPFFPHFPPLLLHPSQYGRVQRSRFPSYR